MREPMIVGLVAVGIQREDLLQNVSGVRAGQIPIGVIGEIHDGVFVGGRGVIELQFIVVGERVLHGDVKIAGIIFFAVGTVIGEDYRRGIR